MADLLGLTESGDATDSLRSEAGTGSIGGASVEWNSQNSSIVTAHISDVVQKRCLKCTSRVEGMGMMTIVDARWTIEQVLPLVHMWACDTGTLLTVHVHVVPCTTM